MEYIKSLVGVDKANIHIRKNENALERRKRLEAELDARENPPDFLGTVSSYASTAAGYVAESAGFVATKAVEGANYVQKEYFSKEDEKNTRGRKDLKIRSGRSTSLAPQGRSMSRIDNQRHRRDDRDNMSQSAMEPRHHRNLDSEKYRPHRVSPNSSNITHHRSNSDINASRSHHRSNADINTSRSQRPSDTSRSQHVVPESNSSRSHRGSSSVNNTSRSHSKSRSQSKSRSKRPDIRNNNDEYRSHSSSYRI